MTTITGIPAHALLVHAIVVLAPLTALLAMLCAVWPAARVRLVWLVLAFAAVTLVLTPLTTSAGNWLFNQQPQPSDILITHANRGWLIAGWFEGPPPVIHPTSQRSASPPTAASHRCSPSGKATTPHHCANWSGVV